MKKRTLRDILDLVEQGKWNQAEELAKYKASKEGQLHEKERLARIDIIERIFCN